MNFLPQNQGSECWQGVCTMQFSGSLNKMAVEAGRDSAALFRTLIETKGFAFAADQARRIIISQSPTGYMSIACRAFEQNVEPRFKAKSFSAINGREAVAIIEDQRSYSLETTLQMGTFNFSDSSESLTVEPS